MEECAMGILEKEGLQNRSMRKIVLAGLTAEPLQRMLRALLIEYFNHEEFNEMLRQIFSEFERLTSTRNSIIHGKWIPPIDDEMWQTADKTVLSRKLKTSKRGEDSEYLKYSEADFKKDIESCNRMQKAIKRIDFLCTHPDKIFECFDISGGKLQILD
ncbi:hypothetical protein CS8_010710 [Cupriavidus sp. 8B]